MYNKHETSGKICAWYHYDVSCEQYQAKLQSFPKGACGSHSATYESFHSTGWRPNGVGSTDEK